MTSKLLQTARSAALSIALAALASCGGGGGGGNSLPPVQAGGGGPPVPTAPLGLTSANMQDVAAGATLAGLGTSSLSTLLDGASALSASSAGPALPRTHVLTRFIKQQIDQLIRPLQTPPGVRVATAVTPPACISGTAAVADNGPNSVTETFSACSPEAGVSLSGTITINNMIADPGVSFSASATINLVLKQTGFADVSFMASNITVLETINVDVGTFTLSGQEMFITTGAVTERLGNFTLMASFTGTTETDDVTFSYASTKIGGSVNVSTVTPCVTDSAKNFPSSGVLSLTGAGGSKLRVTINGDETLATPQLTIDLDANGDGAVDTTLNKNWSDLAG